MVILLHTFLILLTIWLHTFFLDIVTERGSLNQLKWNSVANDRQKLYVQSGGKLFNKQKVK